MKEHTFHLDTSSSPAEFEFSETFNVVVPFIDRPVYERDNDIESFRKFKLCRGTGCV